MLSETNFVSDEISPEAVDFARQLKLIDKLKRLAELQQQVKSNSAEQPQRELRDELRDLKEELTEIIEQTRLEIEYVLAELRVEEALQTEIFRAYSEERDNRVNRCNAWSFRTNGVLWTLNEALSIPTWNRPRYTFTSATFGILAGVVPTAFSMLGAWQSQSGKFRQSLYPNMLAKIFDYPINSRVDYPDSVWTFLQSRSTKSAGKSRLDLLVDQWVADKNIHILTNRNSKEELDIVTGNVDKHISIDLLTDRVTMLTQLEAVIRLMNRPLLELMMAVRGSKHLPANI